MKPKKKTHAPPSWAGLADGLQVARRTVYSWRQLPGAPRGAGLAAWRAFVAKRNLGVAPNRMTPERAELLREKMGKEIRLLGLKISSLEAVAMPIQEVSDLLRFLATFTKTTLAPLGAELGARCSGKSAEELNTIGPVVADEFLTRLAEAVAKWSEGRTAKVEKPEAAAPKHHVTPAD